MDSRGADLPPEAGESPADARVQIRAALSKARILEDSLVLSSQRIRHWIEFDGERYALTLPAHDAAKAVETLRQYEQENRGYGPQPADDSLDLHLSPLLHLALPTGLFFWVNSRVWGEWATRRGSSQAGELLGGEWWRAVTATTLHADLEHLLGNLLSGFFILNLLRRRCGIGTWMPVLTLAAALTNVLVALISDPGRTSLGFSTVVFAALGLLAGLETLLLPKGRAPGLRGLSPLFAAFFLAVMMGLGENADIKAHFVGFGLGAASSAAVFFIRRTAWERWYFQAAGVVATCGVYAWAWWRAVG
jgi:rhomboid protease GluP